MLAVILDPQYNIFFKFFFETEGQPGQRQNELKQKQTRPQRGEAGPLGRETPPRKK